MRPDHEVQTVTNNFGDRVVVLLIMFFALQRLFGAEQAEKTVTFDG
jgi:hypothetical protein